MQSLQNDGKDENDERDDDDNDHHHHNQLTKIAPFIGKVLILSEAGKPIYYRFLHSHLSSLFYDN